MVKDPSASVLDAGAVVLALVDGGGVSVRGEHADTATRVKSASEAAIGLFKMVLSGSIY